ncbi:hypothetical protein H5V45_11695 [Nocardioides sp. KIGAM211]|uniref:Bacterial Ig-like domain-containing protein n=1 Tax=Nocardioides luti TaxID=2761101 RepID=A0A7X0RIK8_9ACTN|nr:hypothetical protein [Nocardioides luti]MBB6627980.1 hypothetical protein [Nocardioides luti]
MSSTRLRRTATWAGATLVAALVPIVVVAAPSRADAGCTSEVASGMLVVTTVCDDSTPPVTAPVAMSPVADANGYLDAQDGNDVTFTFSGSYDDADTDPITLQCQLGTSPTPVESAWETCTSPKTYPDLAESGDGPAYVFLVRAVDAADQAIAADQQGTNCPPVSCTPASSDVPDLDATPASTTFRVDTVKPSTVVFGGPVDNEGTGSPIATAPQTSFTIDSNEDGATFRCALDGANVPCGKGSVPVGGLTGGDKTFSARATDPAGNEGVAATKSFTVPYDLTRSRHWKLVRAKGAFAGKVLMTRQSGSRVRLTVRNVREIRLLAPANPKLGKIRVRVGTGAWKVINLGQGTAPRITYLVRSGQSALVSGPVVIEALPGGKPVRVDALVFPPG